MPELPDASELKDKVLLVWLKQHPTQFPGGMALEYPELRTVGNVLFLSGRGPSAEGRDWNIPYLLSWEGIALIMTFATRQDLLAQMGGGKGGLASRLSWALRGSHS